ncbi:MAG: hypothetical protein R3219_01880 [Hydrogenovibrio sp.]|nr:hypothetical protein [Hydrogenovibrio sp.]
MVASPLEWIRLECVPLPDAEVDACVVYWNPTSRDIQGQRAEFIRSLAEAALKDGYIKTPTLSHFEITDPLAKPSELAAVLGQYFWVIPQPVEGPGPEENDEMNSSHLLQ